MIIKLGNNNRGIALILTVGILALMVIIGTSFAVNMMAEYKVSSNQAFSEQANGAAEAGLNLAILYLRNLAAADFNAVPTASCDWNYISSGQPSFDLFDGIANNSTSGSLGNVGKGNIAVFSLQVVDTASQINVDDTNPNLGAMLENLVSILGAPLAAGDGTAIVTNRPVGGYLSKEQVIDAIPGADLAAKRTKFNLIAGFITVNSYIDQNSGNSIAPPLTGLNNPPYSYYQAKAPININTAKSEVLQAELRTMISNQKAAALAAAIITQRGATPFRTWNGPANAGGFDNFIDTVNISPAPPLTSSEAADIKNNANPNRVKPWSYSTDFCFQPSGIYEITSTGTVGADTNSDRDLTDGGDVIVARKQIDAFVRIYNILNYTTKEQFRGDYYTGGASQPTFARVSWLNSCPVEMNNADQGLGLANNYKTVPNSLKLGYWDNFDEDNDNIAKAGFSWKSFSQESSMYPMNISDVNGDGDNELSGTGWPKFTLDSSKWTFSNNFSIRIYLKPNPMGDGSADTGSVEFTWGGDHKAKLWIQHWGFLYNPGRVDITLPPPYWRPTVAIDTVATATEGKDFFDSRVMLEFWDPPYNERVYHVGDLYGLIDPITDHYDDPPTAPSHYFTWASEQGQDQYHGIFPSSNTFKLIVNSAGALAPNYRLYLALGQGTHNYYNYSNGYYMGWYGLNAPAGYILVPFYSDGANSAMGDRYNYWRYLNSQPNSWRTVNWYLVLYGNHAMPAWDDIRIIPSNGFYQSPSFSPGVPVRWGTVSWTLSMPSTADPNKEQCTVQVDTGGGLNNVAINGPIGGISNSEVFRVNFTSTDDDYSETPVFEDITITYLPRVQILYLKHT